MRYLILSDLHSNWEALEAVLDETSGRHDEILCCGDLVGYAADPNRIVDWARANIRVIVRGNHDKAAIGLEDLEWFNEAAQRATIWTARELTPENLRYLEALPKGPVEVGDFQIMHGSPLDEDDYLVSSGEAATAFPYLNTEVAFFGHTHLQGGFLLHRNGTRRLQGVLADSPRFELELASGFICLLNPGSVGQPRDGDPRAAYALYEPEERLVTFGRVAYDLAKAQEKILRAGLPEHLAQRLALGI